MRYAALFLLLAGCSSPTQPTETVEVGKGGPTYYTRQECRAVCIPAGGACYKVDSGQSPRRWWVCGVTHPVGTLPPF